ncbi:MAG TPA: cytochrome c [Terracidiphilus sp.]|nr:cytochrome c [Terracidiphilus sp.]
MTLFSGRLFSAALILFFAASVPAFASSRSQRARGAETFVSAGCQHCHSIRNTGGHRGPDLSGVGRKMKKTAIRKQIVEGSKVMPAFKDVLTPSQVDDLVAYLRSCRDKQTQNPSPSPDTHGQ